MDRMLKPRAVAETLEVTPRTVVRWITSGDLRGVKVGRVWRVPEKELEAYLKRRRSGRVQPVSDQAVS